MQVSKTMSLFLNLAKFIAAILVGGIVEDIGKDWLAKKAIGTPAILATVIIFIMVVILSAMQHVINSVKQSYEKLLSETKEVYSSNRLHIEYFSADGCKGLRTIYDECTKVIKKAAQGGQIYAVNSYVEMFNQLDCFGTPEETADVEAARKNYFSALEECIAQTKYIRLLQVEHTGGIDAAWLKIAASYQQHFEKMLEPRQRTSAKQRLSVYPELKWLEAMYPTSFVLIDNPGDGKYLIWQLNEHRPGSSEALQMRGVFLIHDPEEKLVGYFRQWFQQMNRVATEMRDKPVLPSLPASVTQTSSAVVAQPIP